MVDILDNMTQEQQQAWWHRQAVLACEQIISGSVTLILLAHTHHAVFKVRAEDNTYILKITQTKNADQLLSEFTILQTLSKSALNIAHPLGQYAGDSTYSILISYVYGDEISSRDISTEAMTRIGRFLADFHLIPTDTLSASLKRLDWAGLFSETGIYHPGEDNLTAFTDHQHTIIDEVTKQVQSAMNALGQEADEFGLIHGDLLLKNILFYEDDVRALDFEYCGWGYYLYDLTPILWQLKPQARYQQLADALWQGYNTIRPLTAHHRDLLEIFIAGRQVASMRWVVANQQNSHITGKVASILAQRTAELSVFLETGILERH